MRFLAVVVAAVLLAGCGGDPEPSDAEPQAGSRLESVTGVITTIDPPEGDVESFIIDSDDAGRVEVLIDPEVDYGFDLHHLHEHLESGDPVIVDLDARGAVLFATAIEDV